MDLKIGLLATHQERNYFSKIIVALLLSSNFLNCYSQTDQQKLDPFSFKATIQGGFFNNHVGGLRTGGDYMGRIHLTMSFDTSKGGWWRGGTFFINGVSSQGGSPTATYLGDYQPISRNEAFPERTGIFELWYRHSFKGFQITLGQHDMNAEIGTSKYAGLSIHSAFGMNPSITPNLGGTFSIFPRTMPGLIVRTEPLSFIGKELVILSAVYAGSSYDLQEDPYNFKWRLNESSHSRLELQLHTNENDRKEYTFKLGLINHTGSFPSVVDGNETVEGNFGYYAILDYLLTDKEKKDGKDVGLFLQLGSAPGRQNLINWFGSFGFVCHGINPNRKGDSLFLAFLNSSFRDDLVDLGFLRNRSVIEINYSMKLFEHITLQPDIQYIINPGNVRGVENALLTVLRFSIDY